MGGVRAIVSGLALSLASVILTLLAIEAALRTGLLSPTIYRSTRIETRLAANMQQPNFRERGFELTRKGQAFRIVVIGDSFAWGDGVHPEDAYPLRLETRLNAVTKGTRFEVINWSRPGWNTVRQAGSLVPALPELDPDLLILAFVLNDSEPIEQTKVDAMLARTERREPAAGLSVWLFEHSRLYGFVWSRLENKRQHRELSAYYRSLFEGDHWRACVRALKRLRNAARDVDVPLIMVVFPVFDGQMDDTYLYTDLHAKIRHEAEQLEIPVLDLMETYRGIDGRRLAVTPFSDAHPNELAHRLAADSILDYLVRGRLVPPVEYKPVRRRKPRRREP